MKLKNSAKSYILIIGLCLSVSTLPTVRASDFGGGDIGGGSSGGGGGGFFISSVFDSGSSSYNDRNDERAPGCGALLGSVILVALTVAICVGIERCQDSQQNQAIINSIAAEDVAERLIVHNLYMSDLADKSARIEVGGIQYALLQKKIVEVKSKSVVVLSDTGNVFSIHSYKNKLIKFVETDEENAGDIYQYSQRSRAWKKIGGGFRQLIVSKELLAGIKDNTLYIFNDGAKAFLSSGLTKVRTLKGTDEVGGRLRVIFESGKEEIF